jgi:hypothetical protein
LEASTKSDSSNHSKNKNEKIIIIVTAWLQKYNCNHIFTILNIFNSIYGLFRIKLTYKLLCIIFYIDV